MTRAEFDAFCGGLKGVTHVVQWGGASVWKIGGKIFAICSTWSAKRAGSAKRAKRAGDHDKIGFKCSDIAYAVLTEQKGIVPCPYLARAKWIQIEDAGVMNDEDIHGHIETAYFIVAGRLTRAKRKEIGLILQESG